MKVTIGKGFHLYGTRSEVVYHFPDSWSEAERRMLIYHALRVIAGDANVGQSAWVSQGEMDKALQRFFLTRTPAQR